MAAAVFWVSKVEFYLRPGYGHGHSTNLSAIGKISVTNITRTGLLVIHFDDQNIRLAPGSDWSRQVGLCGGRICITNHGFLDKSTNNKTSRTRRPLD